MAYTGRDESVEFMWSEGRVGTQAGQSTNYYDGDSIESGAVQWREFSVVTTPGMSQHNGRRW